jgi:hypothetical protein
LNKNMTMKKIQKYTNLAIMLGLLAIVNACQDVEAPTPSPTSQANGSSAKFLFLNASPDAPSLDLYINGSKVIFPTNDPYAVIPLLGNGTFGNTGNTSIRAKASSGTIGGVLADKDIVFRSTTTGLGNFNAIDQANVNGANYSVFVVDTIGRPLPKRTLNASNIGDITYFTKNTGTQISAVEFSALSDKTTVVPIGVVPVATTDPGGPRFWISQDIFRAPATFASGAAASQAEIRVLNTIPNSNPTLLYVRLNPSTGSPIVVLNTSTTNPTGGLSYFMSVAPSAATPFPSAIVSRSVTAPFNLVTIATTAAPITPIDYTVEVSTSSTFATTITSATLTGKSFTPGKAYTIYIAGLFAKGRTISTGIIQHN